MRPFRLPFRPVLLVAALLCAGVLGGCGVKGALEPPPGVAVDPALAVPATVPAGTVGPGAALGPSQKATEGPGAGASSRPVLEAPAATRSNPLDWLIN